MAPRRCAGALGIACLAATCVLWVGQTEMSRFVQTSLGFDNVWFLVWFNHAWSMLLIPVNLAWLHRCGRNQKAAFYAQARTLVAKSTVLFSAAFFAADYLWFSALPLISSGMAMTVFNSSPVFVFMFSVWLLKTPVKMGKVVAVLVCLAGVVCTAFAPPPLQHEGILNLHNSSSATATSGNAGSGSGSSGVSPGVGAQVLGCIFAFTAAALYAICDVLFKVYVTPEEEEDDPIRATSDAAGAGSGVNVKVGPKTDAPAAAATALLLSQQTPLLDAIFGPGPGSGFNEASGGGGAAAAITAEADYGSALPLNDAAAVNNLNIALGMANAVLFWPVVPGMAALSASGFDVHGSLPTWEIMPILCANAALSFASNVCLPLACALLNPLVAAVGCILSVPGCIAFDVFLLGFQYNWQTYLGSGLVIGGFVLLAIMETQDD